MANRARKVGDLVLFPDTCFLKDAAGVSVQMRYRVERRTGEVLGYVRLANGRWWGYFEDGVRSTDDRLLDQVAWAFAH